MNELQRDTKNKVQPYLILINKHLSAILTKEAKVSSLNKKFAKIK